MRAILRRLGVYLLAAWVALTVSFLLPRVVPGNPVAGAVARASQSGNCNSQCVMAIEEQLGYNVHTSMWDQYLQYVGNLVHGDLGHSWSENAPVSSLILQYLPWTLGLLVIATIIAFVAGTAIGILIAWRRGSWADWILPGATLILGSMAGFILTMRNNMMTTLDEDFVLVAAAKGLPGRSVVWYAARNALLPVVANFTIAISLLVAGQILVEIVFNYPGIGFHLFDALGKLDYSLVQGIFVVITLVVLAANLLADVVYVMIDPRARQAA